MSRLASRVRPPLAFVRPAASRRGRPLLRFASAVLVTCFVVPHASAQGEKPIGRLRSPDRAMVQLLREGCRRSPSFKQLCEEIEHSDLIVYFEASTQIPRAMQAYLQLAGATSKVRIVRVAVRVPASTETLISQMGHELQHATELAQATEVRDQAAMEALYRRIGDENEAGWDTPAARAAGARVLEEVRRSDSHTLRAEARPAGTANGGATAGGPPK